MKNNSIVKELALGVGVAAIVAGTYFLYGASDAPKNRRKVKAWMFRAKGEILEQLENLSEVSEDAYYKIVEKVSKKYQALKKLDKKDVAEFVDELKDHWKNIAKELGISK